MTRGDSSKRAMARGDSSKRAMARGDSSKRAMTRDDLARGTRLLGRRDAKLGAWIETIGPISLRRQRHRFGTLCRAILSQQLAAKAAMTIHGRFVALFDSGRPDPASLLRLNTERLRACGVSRPKAEYLRSLAREFDGGALRAVRLGALDNDEVIARLTRVSGIGVWTAEMFLIFALGRPDVFSVGDLGLREGVQRLEGRSLTSAEISAIAERWSPYRSIASLYLWKIVHWPGASPIAAESK
jgi:DNA-3-methyladenine glycosylase II